MRILKRDSNLRVFLNLIEKQARLLRCERVFKFVSWIVSIRRQKECNLIGGSIVEIKSPGLQHSNLHLVLLSLHT